MTVILAMEFLQTAILNTLNGERFAGLNFRVFRGYELTAKVFP